MPTNTGEDVLKTVLGARLTSVNFVLDYLILGFDSRGALTTLVWPKVLSGRAAYDFGLPGYRDSLCGFLTHVVSDVRVTNDETIIIEFDRSEVLQIPLRTRTDGGERAIFTAPNHILHTW